MKKKYVILALIAFIAMTLSVCTNSNGPTPNFKYLGIWIGQNSFADSVEIHVENVSNKQKVTYIKFVVSTKSEYHTLIHYNSDGLTEVTDSSFTYIVSAGFKESGTISGSFQNDTFLTGDFTITFSENNTFTGDFTATKQ